MALSFLSLLCIYFYHMPTILIGGNIMEKVKEQPQETTYKIGYGNYNISRIFKGEKPLKNVIMETITSEKSQSHN